MKKPKIKLSLNKETLQVINDFEMSQVNGGENQTSSYICMTGPTPLWNFILYGLGYGGGYGGGEGIKSTWYQSGADTRPVLVTNCNLQLH